MPTQQTALVALAAAAAPALLRRRRRRRVPPPGPQQPPLVLDARMLDRVLSTIEEEILPQTKTQLARGNKMFGAAVLDAHVFDVRVRSTTPDEDFVFLSRSRTLVLLRQREKCSLPSASSCSFQLVLITKT